MLTKHNFTGKEIYSVETFSGVKSIHILAYCYKTDNPEATDHRLTEYTFCIIPLDEFIQEYAQKGQEYVDGLEEEVKQYEKDLTEEEAYKTITTYFDGLEPTPLAMDDLTADTPEGNYINMHKSQNNTIQGYSGRVSFENTRKLTEAGLTMDRPFRAGWDFTSEGTLASAVDLETTGRVLKAPTYGEAFDFLRSKGAAIGMIPCFTFALKDHIAFGYIIGIKDDVMAGLKTDTDPEYGSFNLEAEAAITRALDLLSQDSTGQKND